MNRESEPLANRVAYTVADKEGISVTELSPLAESVDADALNRLFSSSSGPVSICFQYEGYTVRVDEHENITLIDKEHVMQ
jgi:hypothetical protein